MARLSIRIDLDSEAAFGPGKARLLELIGERGSIRAAALAMDMSYRRAWLLVHEIETIMGAPVVTAATGGAGGGGTRLTSLGQNVLERYRAIERRAARSVASELLAMDKLTRGAAGRLAAPRNLRKPSRKS